jgi:hypothetical protein
MKKIKIREKHDKISLGSLEGSIESSIEYLQSIRESIPSDVKIYLSIETKTGYYGDSDYQYFEIYTSRLETDEEYEKRMAENKNAKVKKRKEKEAEEKAEYNRYLELKAKYAKE